MTHNRKNKLPTGEKKKRRTIRFSDKEWNHIEGKASKTGLSRSEFIRDATLNKRIVSKFDIQSYKELHWIGVHIKRISIKYYQENRIAEEQELRKILVRLLQVMNELI